jgi:hypothetical protein
VPGISRSLRYVGCCSTSNVISGILAELQKKATFGSLDSVNLNPIGERKFLFCNCLSKALAMVFYLYLDKKRGSEDPLNRVVN